MIFQVLVLTPLVLLGLVAFARCLEIAIDDWEFVTRITRLRCTYDQLVPELAPLMSQAVADGGLVAMLSPRWQPFQKDAQRRGDHRRGRRRRPGGRG
jgi:hypothetical protein